MKHISSYVEVVGEKGEDALAVIQLDNNSILIAVTDGAGGRAGGYEDSQYVIDNVKQLQTVKGFESADDVSVILHK